MDGTSVPGGQAFAATAWTVTDGPIITSSANLIVIPVYPIGNQLSALSLTVGAGLGINVGDPVTIADTATGLNTMRGYVTSYSAVTGAMTVQIGWAFNLEIRRTGARYDGSGYIPWYDFGVPDEYGPLIQATLGNGLLITDIGIITVMIPAWLFQSLRGGTYSVAMICTDSVNTRQIFAGALPVQHGGVSRFSVPIPTGAFGPAFNPAQF